MDIGAFLDEAGSIAGDVATGVEGPVGIAAAITAAALKAGAAFAKAGKDPLIEVVRMLSASKAVARVEGEWQSEIDKKFSDPEDT
jgi:ACR3 family arsenite efflux pump ArsB